jgi:lipopolysaccharide export system permease protein
MQFLWKYIDDLIGKGLNVQIIIELLWYSMLTLIPMALPLAVLLASMMLTGKLAEQSELIAIHSIGVSFIQFIKPLLYVSIFIGFISFMFSNYTIPYANLKTTNLMYDIMHKKLNINIKEKVFFSDIEGYSIRFEKKLQNNIMEDIIIYDYKNKNNITRIFTANTGIISTQHNKLIIHLNNGKSYSDVSESIDKYIVQSKFTQYELILDLSEFEMARTSSERFNNRSKTMNIKQLKVNLDSLNNRKYDLKKGLLKQLEYINVDNQSNTRINKKINHTKTYKNQQKSISSKINKFEVELHRKFTLALACIIMFIIGAPVGSVIKKGGLGLPVIFSILLFLIYYVISITGEKMVKKGILNVEIGMWASTYIMLIIGLSLIIIINNNYGSKLKS